MVDAVSTPPLRATDLFSDPLDAHPLWFKSNLSQPSAPSPTSRSSAPSFHSTLSARSSGPTLPPSTTSSTTIMPISLISVPSSSMWTLPWCACEPRYWSRGSVDGSLAALRNGLQQRSEAAAAREVLQLLLDTFYVVSKSSMSNGTSLQPIESGTNIRETQSMLLERIASEMNRLKLYMAHKQYRTFLQ
ncbi:hypothetical protein MANES_14G052501v8 [Manihot esculenta]|uniref:Uncharacterized protein n=1 Tax=Manihot esculenta TaxID=3983 RepID=A0ACB7GIW3_MANES|nr:hypothetical protein MANES_14G052501v8 [Manihot esculenta]